MELATNPQKNYLHQLYRTKGIDSKELLFNFTSGRTETTKELTKDEACQLITMLLGDPGKQKKRRVIYSIAREAGIIFGYGDGDNEMNKVTLNKFLVKNGAVKKPLEAMDEKELDKTVRQMKAVVKNNAACKDNKLAKTVTEKMLSEMGVPVTRKGKSRIIAFVPANLNKN